MSSFFCRNQKLNEVVICEFWYWSPLLPLSGKCKVERVFWGIGPWSQPGTRLHEVALKNTVFWSVFASFRMIGPLYADGITSPRISVKGNALPLSRVVSTTMHPDDNKHEHAATVMLIAWGQFMDHDFTLTATPLGKSFHLGSIARTWTYGIINYKV